MSSGAVAGAAQSQQPPPPQSTLPESAECTQAKAAVTQLGAKLKDWPAIARYHEDNAKITPPARKKKRVVFMGDSITDSWDNPANGGFFPGKPYMDRGISGQTTPQMLIRFRADVIALRPEVVVILAGTNDIAGNTGPMTLEAIEDNLMSMAELAKAHGIRVVLSSVMSVCDYIRPQTERRPPEKIIALNSWIKDCASRNEFVYLDYYSSMLDERGVLKKELTFTACIRTTPGTT